MNIYGWNTINAILSIRTYINTSIILLPTNLLSLLSHLSSTLFRTFQSLCIMTSSYTHIAEKQLAEITFAGLITCFEISIPVALLVSAKTIFRLCPTFNLKAFKRQQLYKICPYRGSIIICQWWEYNLIYSLFNSTYSKVHFKIEVMAHTGLGFCRWNLCIDVLPVPHISIWGFELFGG